MVGQTQLGVQIQLFISTITCTCRAA